MTRCRIARRVALAAQRQNPYGEAVSARTLATKVSHYPLRHFMPSRGRRWLLVRQDDGGQTLTGLRVCLGSGGARRVVWPVLSTATLFAASSLATKGLQNGDVE